MAEPKICGCGARLAPRNTSGRCRPCGTRAFNTSAETIEKRRRATRKKWQDPAYREHMVACIRADVARPERKAQLRAKAVAQGLNKLGLAAISNPTVNARRARRISQSKMPWCPPHLIEEARWLRNQKQIPAAQVKEIILAQVETNRVRLRNRMLAGVRPC